jgi:hypothetical protein
LSFSKFLVRSESLPNMDRYTVDGPDIPPWSTDNMTRKYFSIGALKSYDLIEPDRCELCHGPQQHDAQCDPDEDIKPESIYIPCKFLDTE